MGGEIIMKSTQGIKEVTRKPRPKYPHKGV